MIRLACLSGCHLIKQTGMVVSWARVVEAGYVKHTNIETEDIH